jgi:aspartyl-tRNA synthetase
LKYLAADLTIVATYVGNKMLFLALRQRLSTIQALIVVNPNSVSKHMVKWAAGLPAESIVLVEGTAQKPAVPVESTTISDCEILVHKACILILDIVLSLMHRVSLRFI